MDKRKNSPVSTNDEASTVSKFCPLINHKGLTWTCREAKCRFWVQGERAGDCCFVALGYEVFGLREAITRLIDLMRYRMELRVNGHY